MPILTWNSTKDVGFVMAYMQERSNGGYKLSGMVRDTRGRRHRLFDSHVDAQFIDQNGVVTH